MQSNSIFKYFFTTLTSRSSPTRGTRRSDFKPVYDLGMYLFSIMIFCVVSRYIQFKNVSCFLFVATYANICQSFFLKKNMQQQATFIQLIKNKKKKRNMFSIPHPKRLDLSERNHQPNVKLTHKFTTTRPLQILHCKTLVSEESTQPHPPSLSPFKLPLATRGVQST